MNSAINPAYEKLHETALKAPSSSGVYLWRNKSGTVIYVGKAKNLKNRLSSYFSGERHIKVQMLVSAAFSIEYITTSNEYEAFILENNLIKKYTPRYNIQLKDGKSYPVLKVTNEEFPRVYKTRIVKKDGSTYFGPYPDSGALDTFIETLYKIYPLRHCKTFKKKSSPCMYYHIGRCKAPCCNKISKESYIEYIDEIKALLEKKDDETLIKITNQMKEAAEKLNFEKAARLRDAIKALTIMQNQNIVEDNNLSEDRDYINYWREGELVSFAVLKVRNGKLLGRDTFCVESLADDTELLEEFSSQYYDDAKKLPPKIYVSEENSSEILNLWLEKQFNSKTKVVKISLSTDDKRLSAENKKHAASLMMAKNNAHEDIIKRKRERGDMPALIELKNLLSLAKLPERIEGFDIAHIGGKFPVASLISFFKGNPDKKNYRYFRLKTTDGVIDDFASMKEATTRRYSRLKNENSPLPDLILIDGGIGQVNAVYSVIKALDLEITIAGLAKRDEEIWLPHASKPICLPKQSDALRLLQRVRDETHRFATTQNQKLRTKENTKSIFLELPFIGEAKEKIIIKKYTTLKNFANAPKEEIKTLLHLNDEKATLVLEKAKELSETREQIKKQKKLVTESLTNQFFDKEKDSISTTSLLAKEALDL